jgi:hypothetical protein
MDHLPPALHDELATKADISRLEESLRGRITQVEQRLDRLDTRLEGHLERLYGMMRTYFLGIVGGFFALLAAIIATGILG